MALALLVFPTNDLYQRRNARESGDGTKHKSVSGCDVCAKADVPKKRPPHVRFSASNFVADFRKIADLTSHPQNSGMVNFLVTLKLRVSP
jgi:hypothetical protein